MFVIRHWQRNLSVLLWTILLTQFVVWLSEYWLSATTTIVYAVLWTVFVIELLYPLHWLLRRAIQLIAVIYIPVHILDYQPIGGTIDSLSGLLEILNWNISQLLPYLWFALVTWLLLLIVTQLMVTKPRIIYMVVLSTVVLAIADSYTFYILWSQAATVVFCGLLLTINQHFIDFKTKNPASWSYFKEYPSGIITPIIIIVSVSMLVGIFMPSVRPVIKDPYTAWKHWRGESVQTVGKGYDVFALTRDASSGYRRDDSIIGEGFNFDYSEVMRINTNFRSYWRGETRSYYNGNGWVNPAIDVKWQFDDPVLLNSPEHYNMEHIDTSRLQTMEVRQTVQMVTEEVYPVLFGAYHMSYISSLDGEDEQFKYSTSWSPEYASMHWDVKTGYYPKTYTVVSQVPIIDEAGLRELSMDYVDEDTMSRYLQLPDELPERVIDLAHEVTALESNPYDMVKSVEHFLKTEYLYTNRPNVDGASSDDLVDRFLFEVQEGYCDYFSSSMVVLTRALGIPARWVKGYSSGVLPVEDYITFIPDQFIDRDAGGTYTVRNADAHSWVEVYFEGWGWLPFEPTSGFMAPVVYPDEQESSFIPAAAEIELPTIEREGLTERWVPSIPTLIIFAMLMMAMALVIWKRQEIIRFIQKVRYLIPQNKELLPNHKVVKEFERFLKFASKRGYTRAESETVREMISRWICKDKWLMDDLDRLMTLFERAKYSSSILSHDEHQTAVRLCGKLREELK